MPDLPGPPDGDAEPQQGVPAGEVYDWYHRGRDLLDAGDAAAAALLLARALEAEPDARSIREALARAQFDAGRYTEARHSFAAIVDADPADHYAQFGLGLSAARLDDLAEAATHLVIASSLRPDIAHYAEALRQVRATTAARERAIDDAAVEGFARARRDGPGSGEGADRADEPATEPGKRPDDPADGEGA